MRRKNCLIFFVLGERALAAGLSPPPRVTGRQLSGAVRLGRAGAAGGRGDRRAGAIIIPRTTHESRPAADLALPPAGLITRALIGDDETSAGLVRDRHHEAVTRRAALGEGRTPTTTSASIGEESVRQSIVDQGRPPIRKKSRPASRLRVEPRRANALHAPHERTRRRA